MPRGSLLYLELQLMRGRGPTLMNQYQIIRIRTPQHGLKENAAAVFNHALYAIEASCFMHQTYDLLIYAP